MRSRIALGPKIFDIWLDSLSSLPGESTGFIFVFLDFFLGEPACRGTPQIRLSVL